MQVFKFGGASVKDAAAVKNVGTLLQKHGTPQTVVVVSAMGKTTNALEELVKGYLAGDSKTAAILEGIKDFHFSIANALFEPNNSVFNALENVFVELQWGIEDEPSGTYSYHYDQLVAQGEILSTHIVSAYLNQIGVHNTWFDARNVLQTDNTYREGKIDYELSASLAKTQLLPALQKHGYIVTQGFIGGTSENFTTTLGREGSDYTAALLAYFLDAQRVVIWKDVPGVLNADPKFFKNTKKIGELSYHDAIELTYFGASVIHPKTIKPLQNKNIPLFVKSFLQPEEEGTVISDGGHRNAVTSYIFKDNQILLSIMPKDFSFIAEDNLSDIFHLFSKYTIHVHLMQNSAISFSVCTDNDEQKLEQLLPELQQNYKVLYNTNVQLMTVRNYDPEIIAKLSENKTVLLEQRSRNVHQMVLKNE
jgi:aspartate kinase